MVHSLIPSPITPIPSSSGPKKKIPLPFLGFQRHFNVHQGPNQALDDTANTQFVHRRAVVWGLASVALGLTNVGNQSASAAKRSPPPPPTEQQEKKDPNVSGVMAKVLASKKRKEAMKESLAKLREKGKPINQTPE